MTHLKKSQKRKKEPVAGCKLNKKAQFWTQTKDLFYNLVSIKKIEGQTKEWGAPTAKPDPAPYHSPFSPVGYD